MEYAHYLQWRVIYINQKCVLNSLPKLKWFINIFLLKRNLAKRSISSAITGLSNRFKRLVSSSKHSIFMIRRKTFITSMSGMPRNVSLLSFQTLCVMRWDRISLRECRMIRSVQQNLMSSFRFCLLTQGLEWLHCCLIKP